MLRRNSQRLFLAVNKAEGMRFGAATAEFHELGLGEPYAISASHGDGVADLIELALLQLGPDPAAADLPPNAVEELDGRSPGQDAAAGQAEAVRPRLKLALGGAPTRGQSTLYTTLLAHNPVITF